MPRGRRPPGQRLATNSAISECRSDQRQLLASSGKGISILKNMTMQRTKKCIQTGITALAVLAATGPATKLEAGSFGDDVRFLGQHTPMVVLRDRSGQAGVALAPAWQGRVMTSTAAGDSGRGFGWINRELIASGVLQPHINVFGGEDRFWLGPEGGQYSIFFSKGAKFDLEHWFTPPAIDVLPYEVTRKTTTAAEFRAAFTLTNYSGTQFEVKVQRAVRLLSPKTAWQRLGLSAPEGVSMVAYESSNKITNGGKKAWRKETGLLSVWILGMFNHSPTTTIVVPIRKGPEAELGRKVTSDYFGSVPPERLVVRDEVIFFSADGEFRSKIGINPRRSKGVLGSYDADSKVLTIVQFTQPTGATDYVNSLWKIQDAPYAGDAANSYNDGPPSPGAKPLGPFYELESSSPAAALAPRKSLTHVHRTLHLSGPSQALDSVARAILGVSLDDIQGALSRR